MTSVACQLSTDLLATVDRVAPSLKSGHMAIS